MKQNDESIYGTTASPFRDLAWGRCTQKSIEYGTRLYLHVFTWPTNGNLVVPGILNLPKRAYLLSDSSRAPLRLSRRIDDLVIRVPRNAPDSINSVVVLDVAGKPDINYPPDIVSAFDIIVEPLDVTISSDRPNVEVRYTLNGTAPTKSSALARGHLRLVETTEVTAQCFRGDKPVSPVVKKTFRKVKPLPAASIAPPDMGLRYSYFEGTWDKMPDFDTMHPQKMGLVRSFDLSPSSAKSDYAFEFKGYILVPKDGVYTFSTESDDGSRLYIGKTRVVDNDGLHAMIERKGAIPLASGLHPLKVEFFQKSGGVGLNVYLVGPDLSKRMVPDTLLFHSD
jgi:alpha-L-fucosidase